jgi:hypothetical protein
MAKLPPEYRIHVTKDAVPGHAGASDQTIMPESEARKVDTTELLHRLKEVLPDKKWRPHLSIRTQVWNAYEKLDRWGYVRRIREARERLSGVMGVLASAYMPPVT